MKVKINLNSIQLNIDIDCVNVKIFVLHNLSWQCYTI